MTGASDSWTAGTSYEAFMGRWSRRLAPAFVAWLEQPGQLHWLDVGCGTGSLVEAICREAAPASVTGCDPSEPFIAFARERVRDPRACFVVADAGQLPRRPGGYGSVTSLLALNFFPDVDAAVQEMRAVTAPGGTVSACVWDYGEGMAFLRRFWDAAIAVDAQAVGLDEGQRFPLCRADALMDLFRRAGLEDVRYEAIAVATRFDSFEDYWRPFLGATGPAPSYVASLDAGRRKALAHRLEVSLPRDAGGAIDLQARAWAVRGTVR